jgi:hypothetical protein
MSTELATEWATPEVDPLHVAAPRVGSDIYFEHTTQFYYALDALDRLTSPSRLWRPRQGVDRE